MGFGVWAAIIILGPMLLLGLFMWWDRPDDLDDVRQRERALKAMEKWSK